MSNLYNRDVNMAVEDVDNSLLKVTASMRNTGKALVKEAYFKISVIVQKGNLEIIDVVDVVLDGSFPTCPKVISKVQNVKGLIIQKGFGKKVIEAVGGREGCIHIVELMKEIGKCAMIAYNVAYVRPTMELKEYRQTFAKKSGECVGFRECLDDESGNLNWESNK
jgi:hypothetical protein